MTEETLTVRDLLTLEQYLDAGGDLSVIPDLESYARVIVIARHTMSEEDRDDLPSFFFHNACTWMVGEKVERYDGEMVEPTPARIRHAKWLCQGLARDDVAERFEAALPEAVRATCWARIRELRG